MSTRSILSFVCVLGLLLAVLPSAAAANGIVLSRIDPATAPAGISVQCTIRGRFLTYREARNPEFSLVRGATLIPGRTGRWDAHEGEWAMVTFALPSGTAQGRYDLSARQDVGSGPLSSYTATATLAGAFQVLSAAPTPLITSVNPSSATAGSGALMLTVNGSGFVAGGHHDVLRTCVRGSEVFWNGASMSTLFISANELRASIPATRLSAPGTAQVTVRNSWDGTASNAVTFTITAAAHAPTILALSPSSAVAGGPAFVLGVTGSGFAIGSSGAVVRWNERDLVTTRESSTHLTAAVPASLIAAAGTASITVRNGLGAVAPVSNALRFAVASPVPTLSSITPTQVWAGYVRNDITLVVNGGNFIAGAHVVLGALEKTNTAFVSATQLTVPLLAADIVSPGTTAVGVKNPAPGGGLSATTKPLAVVPETTVPTVTIAGADTAWHNAPVSLSFAASDGQSGVQKLQYQSPPAVPTWTDGGGYTVPVTTQGAVPVSVQALDWCNHAGTSSVTVNIDTTPPTTAALNAVSVKQGGTARLRFRIIEPTGLSPSAYVVLVVKTARGGRTVDTVSVGNARMNTTRSAALAVHLRRGAYRWYVYATDLAGNPQANVDWAKFTVK
jgi:hypothetical protein